MEKDIKRIVDYLIENKLTIASMESCTGGGFINEITNIEGASQIVKFSAVTYSNEYKIKMGVSREIIDKYTVYSIETANEMSKHISEFSNANIGVGITGQLNCFDPYNKVPEKNIVYISLYYNNKFYQKTVKAKQRSRKANKKLVISQILKVLDEIIENESYYKRLQLQK